MTNYENYDEEPSKLERIFELCEKTNLSMYKCYCILENKYSQLDNDQLIEIISKMEKINLDLSAGLIKECLIRLLKQNGGSL